MADQPPTQNCANCRFWIGPVDTGDDGPLGECKRESPKVLQSQLPEHTHFANMMPDQGRFPLMATDEWCGEWAPANPETIDDAAVTIARFVILGDKTAARGLVDKLKETT